MDHFLYVELRNVNSNRYGRIDIVSLSRCQWRFSRAHGRHGRFDATVFLHHHHHHLFLLVLWLLKFVVWSDWLAFLVGFTGRRLVANSFHCYPKNTKGKQIKNLTVERGNWSVDRQTEKAVWCHDILFSVRYSTLPVKVKLAPRWARPVSTWRFLLVQDSLLIFFSPSSLCASKNNQIKKRKRPTPLKGKLIAIFLSAKSFFSWKKAHNAYSVMGAKVSVVHLYSRLSSGNCFHSDGKTTNVIRHPCPFA